MKVKWKPSLLHSNSFTITMKIALEYLGIAKWHKNTKTGRRGKGTWFIRNWRLCLTKAHRHHKSRRNQTGSRKTTRTAPTFSWTFPNIIPPPKHTTWKHRPSTSKKSRKMCQTLQWEYYKIWTMIFTTCFLK